MKLLRKPSTLHLMVMFTVMSALLGAAASHVVIPSLSAFAQTSSLSLAQDIVDSVQQEETDQLSSSGADDNTQSNTNPQSFDLNLDQDVEAEVENQAEQAAGNLALQDQDDAQEQEEDTTPPTLIVPEDITEEATGPDGSEVLFEVTAQDNVDGTATLDEENTLTQDDNVGGSITISCDPPSDSIFPTDNTEVECTATDEAGNIGRASFTVTVNPVESPRENGKIAFSSQRDGNEEIYVMDADGRDQTRLTNSPGTMDYWPRWSPDGTKIAFSRVVIEGGDHEIYVMSADGSNPTRLTDNPALDAFQNWSPDGTKIVFSSDRDGNLEIYVMDADGSNPTRLTDNSLTNNGQDFGPTDQHPDWSPDGTKIVFSSNRDGNSEIYVMDADGSNPTRLTNTDAIEDVNPSWSPDGTKIAFVREIRISDIEPGSWEIYVMDADGTDQTRLTDNHPANDEVPSWSPDGTKITFSRYTADVPYDIYVMNADGTGETRLTNDPSGDRYPDWGPAADMTDP